MWQGWVGLAEAFNGTQEKKEWTTYAAISPGLEGAGVVEIPPAWMHDGLKIRCHASGSWHSAASVAKYHFAVCWGATSVKLLESEEIETIASGTGTWVWDSWHTIHETGASATAGKMLSNGTLMGLHVKSSATVSPHFVILPESATEGNNGAQETTIETGVTKKLFLAAECNTSSSENKLIVKDWTVEVLN